jgi:hypothetical protein
MHVDVIIVAMHVDVIIVDHRNISDYERVTAISRGIIVLLIALVFWGFFCSVLCSFCVLC